MKRRDFIINIIQNKTKVLISTQNEIKEKITLGEKEIEGLENQIRQLHRQAKDQQSIMKAFEKTPSDSNMDTQYYDGTGTMNNTNNRTNTHSGLSENERETMKYAVMRGQLIDKTKKQNEEIEFLEKELEKMRLKTFPTFSKTTNPSKSTGTGGRGNTNNNNSRRL